MKYNSKKRALTLISVSRQKQDSLPPLTSKHGFKKSEGSITIHKAVAINRNTGVWEAANSWKRDAAKGYNGSTLLTLQPNNETFQIFGHLVWLKDMVIYKLIWHTNFISFLESDYPEFLINSFGACNLCKNASCFNGCPQPYSRRRFVLVNL